MAVRPLKLLLCFPGCSRVCCATLALNKKRGAEVLASLHLQYSLVQVWCNLGVIKARCSHAGCAARTDAPGGGDQAGGAPQAHARDRGTRHRCGCARYAAPAGRACHPLWGAAGTPLHQLRCSRMCAFTLIWQLQGARAAPLPYTCHDQDNIKHGGVLVALLASFLQAAQDEPALSPHLMLPISLSHRTAA